MYFNREGGKIVISRGKTPDSYASSMPATLVIDGEETAAADVGEDFGDRWGRVTGKVCGIEITDTFSPATGNIIRVTRRLANKNDKRVRFKSIFEVRTGFAPTHYLFPGFNYDTGGNAPTGTTVDGSMAPKRSNTPTGLSADGKPWVFAYDREGIPSCTLSEDDSRVVATFASASDEISLRSAASMIAEDGEGGGYMRHRVFHPVSEMPYTYARKNAMEAPYEEYMALAPGERAKLEMYIYLGEPEWPNYGAAGLMEACDGLFPFDKEPWLTNERIWELGIGYFKFLKKDCHGHPMIAGHVADRLFRQMHAGDLYGEKLAVALEDPANREVSDFSTSYEIGWAGQVALVARLIIIDGFRTGDDGSVRLGTDILSAYVETQWENGLLYPTYETNYSTGKKRMPDACNMGWAMAELTRSYRLLKAHGIERPDFLEFSKRLAEFALKDFNPDYGFAKVWNRDGSPRSTEGSVGGFMIMGVLEVWRETKDGRLLDLAKRAMDFYYARDLDRFVCMAGALDCACVDKESAYPFAVAANDLYEITGDAIWLERARKAAYYFFSWMFWYDAVYPQDSDFAKYGYYTTGGTLISAEHSALDPWGALMIRELMRLYKATGDPSFPHWAKMTWCNALLGIAAERGVSIHGNVRPLGSQNEGFFHCRWTKYRPTCEERGHFNENLQTWMGAWRLFTLSELSGEELEMLG